MSIINFCNRKAISCKQSDTLLQSVEKMKKNKVDCLVVTENVYEKEIPQAIITDRDIALSLEKYKLPRNIKVSEIMQKNVVVCDRSESFTEIAYKMCQFGLERIPIVNADGSLCGIVSTCDLLRTLSKELYHVSSIVPDKLSSKDSLGNVKCVGSKDDLEIANRFNEASVL